MPSCPLTFVKPVSLKGSVTSPVPFMRELLAVIDPILGLDIAHHLPYGGTLPLEGYLF